MSFFYGLNLKNYLFQIFYIPTLYLERYIISLWTHVLHLI